MTVVQCAVVILPGNVKEDIMESIKRFRNANISLIVSVAFITQLFPFGNTAFGFSPEESGRKPSAATVFLP
jgi:hypothetical protein